MSDSSFYSLMDYPRMRMDMNMTDDMPMYFEWSSNIGHVLFEFWTVKTPLLYALTLAIFVALAIFNQFLFMISRRRVTYKAEGYEPIDAKQRGVKIFWLVVKPLAFMFQNALSYLLMLAVMTFNVGLFLAIVIGSTIGYAVFSMPSNVAPEECH